MISMQYASEDQDHAGEINVFISCKIKNILLLLQGSSCESSCFSSLLAQQDSAFCWTAVNTLCVCSMLFQTLKRSRMQQLHSGDAEKSYKQKPTRKYTPQISMYIIEKKLSFFMVVINKQRYYKSWCC